MTEKPSKRQELVINANTNCNNYNVKILNLELAKVAGWFDSNKLTLNVNNTQMLMLSIKKNLNTQCEVILHNEAIQRVTKANYSA